MIESVLLWISAAVQYGLSEMAGALPAVLGLLWIYLTLRAAFRTPARRN